MARLSGSMVPNPVSFRLQISDIPKKRRQLIHRAAETLFQQLVRVPLAKIEAEERSGTGQGKQADRKAGSKRKAKADCWTNFAQHLKLSLDKHMEPHWHVLVGENLGFACKKRNQSMAVFRCEGVMIVIWKSPGIEIVEDANDVATSSAKEDADSPGPSETAEMKVGSDGGSEVPTANLQETDSPGQSETAAVKVSSDGGSNVPTANLQVLEPSPLEANSSEAGVVTCLRLEIARQRFSAGEAALAEGDTQELAQSLRKCLTAEFGTIWHVVVGTDFIVEQAMGGRNHVLALAGKMRINCWQHEQLCPSNIDYDKIIAAAPYLCLVLFCFAYMTMNSVCPTEGSTSSGGHEVELSPFAKRICVPKWDDYVNGIGGVAMVLLVISKVRKHQVNSKEKMER